MKKAIIPVKVWGSKGLPNKFCMIMAGKEMWQWVTEAALDCPAIDEVYFSGNSKEYKEFFPRARNMYPRLKWITRPEKMQRNGVELLEVMQHALKKVGKPGDVFIQLQATKPMTTARLLADIIARFESVAFNCTTFKNEILNSLFTIQKIETSINWHYKPSRQAGKFDFKSCAVAKIWDYETLKQAKKGTWGFGKNHHDYLLPARHIEIDTYEDFLIADAMKRGGL